MMKGKFHRGSAGRMGRVLLLTLSLALVAVVGVGGGWWGTARLARAQEFRGQDARARGEYTMVTGRVGSGRPVVYIVDSANQEMVALRWDTGKQNFTGVGYRNILTDARAARGR